MILILFLMPFILAANNGEAAIAAMPKKITPSSSSMGQRTTIFPPLQNKLQTYIRSNGNPIASVVVVEVATGNILAMAEGKKSHQWTQVDHSALHARFPAASLFKTIVTATALEVANFQTKNQLSIQGGCAKVGRHGSWMKESPTYPHRMTLKRAFGQSCNGFFAKIAINKIGLGPILHYSKKFGWNQKPIPADFHIPPSPYLFPQAGSSSARTVGKFAAGFGYVGISTLHAAWQTLMIANNGVAKPLKLFTSSQFSERTYTRIISEDTAQTLRQLMDATVFRGTANYAFRSGKARRIRHKIGGKTGTLSGKAPKGIATWFTGIMPLDDPKIIVAAVVVIEDLWKIKGPHLAAKAFVLYDELVTEEKATSRPSTFKFSQGLSFQRLSP